MFKSDEICKGCGAELISLSEPQYSLCDDCIEDNNLIKEGKADVLNLDSSQASSPYFKPLRKGIIYVCEASDCMDDIHFSHHEEPHVFFHIDEDLDAVSMNYCPPCPVCGSKDNIYEHAIAELKTVKVLNEDEEEEEIEVGVCKICGCTDDNACVTFGEPCHWINDENDICSACKNAVSLANS